MLNPALLPAMALGVRALWRSGRYRPLVWTFVLLEAFFLATGGKAYYPAPILLLLAAAGVAATPPRRTGTGVERRSGDRRSLGRYAAIGGFGVLLLPAVLPVLPEAVFASSPYASQDDARATVGWPQLAHQVDAVIDRTVLDRHDTAILTQSYGEAGALERFSRSDLPVYSGHNSLWYYGRPADDTPEVVTVGYDPATLASWFAQCRTVASVHTPHGLDNQENGAPIAICTRPRLPWAQLWPQLQHND